MCHMQRYFNFAFSVILFLYRSLTFFNSPQYLFILHLPYFTIQVHSICHKFNKLNSIYKQLVMLSILLGTLPRAKCVQTKSTNNIKISEIKGDYFIKINMTIKKSKHSVNSNNLCWIRITRSTSKCRQHSQVKCLACSRAPYRQL